jgi:membrane complex biogenesis BtpA family protein
MAASLLADLFGTTKPVIAMAHFPPLPGTPLYDGKVGVDQLIDLMGADIARLLNQGVDGILFCNEGDRPYALHGNFEAVAVMTHVIDALRPKDRPFGVDFLWDPKVPLAVGMATGASFVREVFTGVYESDMGLWNTDAADVLRYRHNIGADGIRCFYNVTPEFASDIGHRTVGDRARSAVVSSLADAILVSGLTAGLEPRLDVIQEVKQAVGDRVPVLLNTGAKVSNIREFLGVADGVIVGSSLKVDGYTWNAVDEDRVRSFMDVVRQVRQESKRVLAAS